MSTTRLSNIQLSPATITWMQQHISVHRVLVVLTIACFFIAWNRGLALLYGLFSLLLSVLIISYTLPFWQLRSIHISRLQKERLQVGIPGSIHYKVIAPSPRYHLILEDHLLSEKERKLFIPYLHGSVDIPMHLEFLQRGCFSTGPITLSSSYPFGIFNRSKSIEAASDEIIIYPKLVELAHLPLPLHGKSINYGQFQVNKANGYEEFMSLRKYRRGDPIKNIHWNSSARFSQLMVKEQEHLDSSQLLIILNCNPQFIVGEDVNNTLESAIVITASLMAKASKLGFDVHFAAHSYTDIDLNISGNVQNLDMGLDALARITPKSSDYQSTVSDAIKQHPMSNLIITFRLDQDPPIEVNPSHTHIDITMNQHGFLNPLLNISKAKQPIEGNRTVFMVYPTTPIESLFNEVQ